MKQHKNVWVVALDLFYSKDGACQKELNSQMLTVWTGAIIIAQFVNLDTINGEGDVN